MTIEYMRDLMREKVVPEELVPQNLINCLIDEEAEPPKLDAFAFLMRLRALGIGSADFVNLLSGCDAPEEVVEKIRQNPAMNLQGLIVTLDNSELDSDDYTRMLLTARQVWERTLTLRLERSEKITQDMEEGRTADTMELSKVSDAEAVSEEAYEPAEEEDEGDYDYDYDEDMVELSFTAVLDRINEETLAETSGEGSSFTEEFDRMNAEVSETSSETENADDHDLHSGKNAKRIFEGEEIEQTAALETPPAPSKEPEDPKDLSFSQAFDKIKSDKQNKLESADLEDSTDETDFIQVDGESLREKFELLTSEMEKVQPKTAKQKASRKKAKVRDEYEEEYEDDEEEYDVDGLFEEESGKRGYHKGALIGAAVGAAALVGAGFIVPRFIGNRAASEISYAESTDDIFNKIYFAYNDGVTGGTNACALGSDAQTLFGDLLITPSEENGIGIFTLGNTKYVVTEESISASIVSNAGAASLEELIPPENARFVAAFDNGGELYALFSGQQSGYMKITEGNVDHTVLQDGILTDYELKDGAISLGTVYTPVFDHTFGIGDEDVYLPRFGTGTPKPISAQNVAISPGKGYSYGVSAEYSTVSGEPRRSRAVIGDPVAASADGRFAMNGDEGVLINTNGEKLMSEKTGKLSRAAFGSGICAIAEAEDSGNIRLYDGDMKLKSILTGAPASIDSMRFEGNMLIISGSGTLAVVDCTDPTAASRISLGEAVGVVSGSSALTYEVTESALVITRWELRNGSAKKLSEYAREFSADRLASVKFGAAAAVVLEGAQSGAAYSYFDGVSVDNVYVVFAEGAQPKTVSVFDDKEGFTAAFSDGGTIKAICAGGIMIPQ